MRSKACAVLVAAITVLGIQATSASADSTSYSMPFTSEATSCTGEPLLMTGTIHLRTTFNQSTAGTILIGQEANLSGVKGTGMMSGVRYVMNRQFTDFSRSSAVPTGGFSSTFEFKELLTRQGESGTLVLGDDFYARILVHLTANANGVPTATKVEFPEAECR